MLSKAGNGERSPISDIEKMDARGKKNKEKCGANDEAQTED